MPVAKKTTASKGTVVKKKAVKPKTAAGGEPRQGREKPEIQVGLKLRIKLRAYDHKIIDNSARQIIDIANRFGAEVLGPVPLPTEKFNGSTWTAT